MVTNAPGGYAAIRRPRGWCSPLSVRVVTQLAGGGAPHQQLPLTSRRSPAAAGLHLFSIASLSSATRRAPAAAGPGHLELSPSSFITASVSSPLRKERANRLFPKTSNQCWRPPPVCRLASLLPLAWSTALTHQRLLTCVYAVSQRDFSFEFRLRDYFLLGGSLSKGFAYTRFPFSTAQCV